MNHVAQLFSSADISICYQKLALFAIAKNTDIDFDIAF